MKDSIFKNKTFYLMIALCLIIFGVTVYVGKGINGRKSSNVSSVKVKNTSNTVYDDPAAKTHADYQMKNVKQQQKVSETSKTALKKDTGVKSNSTVKSALPKQTATATVLDKSKTTVNNEDNETVNTSVNPGIACLAEPVDGTLLKPYSYKPLYSATLKDLRPHEALDIEAKENSKVKSACDGLVKSVYLNHYLGNTVVVEYNASIKVQYSDLSPKVKVKVGQSVKQGQLIGYVGNTARDEIADSPHLHFAVMRDNQFVDPTKYFIDAKVVSKYTQDSSVPTMGTSKQAAVDKNINVKQEKQNETQTKDKTTTTTSANTNNKKETQAETVKHYLRSMPANFDDSFTN